MPECALRPANGKLGVDCQGSECVYWRLVEQLDVVEGPAPQECAIQHFQLLDGGANVAAWLLSVKKRIGSGRLAPIAP
jgi:hypothetical protein